MLYPISRTMAELRLKYIEKAYVKQGIEGKEIACYKRYVDDLLIIYNQNKIRVREILQEFNKLDKNFQFKMSTEENNTINYLDIAVHRNNNNFDTINFGIHTGTDTTIQFSSNHP